MVAGQATGKFIRTSAQKAGLVMDQIRGADVARQGIRWQRVVQPAKEVIVDLGCGPGAVTRLIVDRLGGESGAEVIGVDPSPSALQRARSR